MTLAVGPLLFDDPSAAYTPIVGVAVGAVDAEEDIPLGRMTLQKKAEQRAFRRLMSTSQTPLPPGTDVQGALKSELNRVVESLHAQVTASSEETVAGMPGKFIEVHYRKGGNDLAAFVLIFAGNDLMYSFSLTVLKGRKTDEARKQFRALQQGLRLAQAR